MQESFPQPSQENEPNKEKPAKGGSFLKKILTFGVGAAAATSSMANEGKTAEQELKNPEHTIKAAAPGDTTSKKNTATFEDGLRAYTESKTKEGGITPTGLSNSFLENKYGITVEDLYTIAQKHNFPTDNNLNFQSHLVDYLEQYRPEVIAKTFEEFGTTTHGKKLEAQTGKSQEEVGTEALKDGEIGGRTAFMLSFLKKELEEPQENVSKPPEQSQEREEQPKGGFVINVRGDEPGNRGAYYFIENAEDFKKLMELVPGANWSINEGASTGTASYDMNQDVFSEYHAVSEEAKKLLGDDWVRNPENHKKFLKKKFLSN